MVEKSEAAFRTIGEVSDEIGVPQHVLRYWETRFPQLKPITRAGNRRYYRPEDVALVRRIHGLLNAQGYTVKGVQKLLSGKGDETPAPASASAGLPLGELKAIRAMLAEALAVA
ncbi:MerR family transcriptional regulator [Sphingomonas oryzagri]